MILVDKAVRQQLQQSCQKMMVELQFVTLLLKKNLPMVESERQKYWLSHIDAALGHGDYVDLDHTFNKLLDQLDSSSNDDDVEEVEENETDDDSQ